MRVHCLRGQTVWRRAGLARGIVVWWRPKIRPAKCLCRCSSSRKERSKPWRPQWKQGAGWMNPRLDPPRFATSFRSAIMPRGAILAASLPCGWPNGKSVLQRKIAKNGAANSLAAPGGATMKLKFREWLSRKAFGTRFVEAENGK